MRASTHPSNASMKSTRTLITGGTILTPDQTLTGHTVVVERSRILRLVADSEASLEEGTLLDAQGFFVAPGLIDVHVHGADGYDTMDATPEALHRMSRFFARHGVTSYLPTTVTASAADIRAAIDNLASTPAWPDGARPLGLHLEGPYLNSDYRGAQPQQHLRIPDPQEYAYWLAGGWVKLITVAPEIPGAHELIQAGVAGGVEFAAGHTGATYEQVEAAVDSGLRQITHLFNGMPPLHHRSPGVVGAALTDGRLWTQVIVDGVHVHPVVVKMLVRFKGVERTLLDHRWHSSHRPVGRRFSAG